MQPSRWSMSSMPSLIVLVACAGGTTAKPVAPTPPAPPATPAVEPVAPVPAPAPPPPPPPTEWRATAQLAPLAGGKLAPVAVVFLQAEGESTSVRSPAALDQLAAGRYHLTIHEGSTCDPRARQIGALRVDLSADAPMVATRHAAPSIETNSRAIVLDGADSIVGHTLVLHADRRGQPGKPVACGVIVGD